MRDFALRCTLALLLVGCSSEEAIEVTDSGFPNQDAANGGLDAGTDDPDAGTDDPDAAPTDSALLERV